MFKRLLKRLVLVAARSVVSHYKPKIEALQDGILRRALMFKLDYSKKAFDALSDDNPNDREQLEEIGREALAEAPVLGIELAEIGIQGGNLPDDTKELMLATLAELKAEIALFQSSGQND